MTAHSDIFERFTQRRLLLCAFVTAHCSMIYELALARFISALLGQTTLHHALSIGTYLFALGVGSLVAFVFPTSQPRTLFLRVELALASLGLLLPLLMLGANKLSLELSSQNPWLFASWAYALVTMIGLLSGMELPLILSWSESISQVDNSSHDEALVLSEFAGSAVAAATMYLVWLPILGLVGSTATFAGINALLAILLLLDPQQPVEQSKRYLPAFILIASLGLITALTAPELSLALTNTLYLSRP